MSYLKFIFALIFFTSANASLVEEYNSLDSDQKFTEYELGLDREGLKVVWWNIDCSNQVNNVKINDPIVKTNLERNILDLSSGEIKPDILILGEYCPIYVSAKVKSAILSKYKYSQHIERNIPQHRTAKNKVNQRNGFLILSDLKIDLLKNETLFASRDKQNSKEDRRYVLFKVNKNGVDYFVNPVHLNQPWADIYDQYGIQKTQEELTSGEDNYNAVQIEFLIENYNLYLDPKDKFLSIGDFNTPGSIFWLFSGFGFQQMAENFDVLLPDHEVTFRGRGAFPESNLDHGFGKNLTPLYARVWPLRGASHLPIYFVIQ